MSEPKGDNIMRAPDVADLDPYNTRGKPKQEAAKELLGEDVEEPYDWTGVKLDSEEFSYLAVNGYFLKVAREIKGIKQAELADLAGIRQPKISLAESQPIEKDYSTTITYIPWFGIIRIAEKLQIDPYELVHEEDKFRLEKLASKFPQMIKAPSMVSSVEEAQTILKSALSNGYFEKTKLVENIARELEIKVSVTEKALNILRKEDLLRQHPGQGFIKSVI